MHTTPQTPSEDAARILRPREVQQLLGLSETSVWRLRRAGDFPKAVRLTRVAIGWRYSDLLAWQASRTAA
ncbi:MAG: AlpA family phage regulatory protein [Acidobacteria bacterium]|nr:AlpA family phage regulatory protein [Acidobacteriota bacterium]